MSDAETQMSLEIHEAPGAIICQAENLAQPLGELVARLQRRPPQLVVTCARGSSAHAATFGKHLIELYLGIPVAPAAPSIASIYNRPLLLNDQLFLAISQSGQSDDLVAMARAAKAEGAITVAITNAVNSPLSTTCDHVISICAGPELSVAATKTFVATAAALARLVAAWARNETLTAALGRLPAAIGRRRGLGLDRGTPCSCRGRQSRYHRPRAHAGDRAGGGTQAQRGLQPPRGGLQRCRILARSRGARVLPLSRVDVHAGGCGDPRHAAARLGPAPKRHRIIRSRALRGESRAIAHPSRGPT